MKKLIAISILYCCSLASFAQDNQKTVYAEALGNGGYNSLNFDYRLNSFAFRLGFGYFIESDVHFLSIPFGASYLIGGEKHNLEVGCGLTYFAITGEAISYLDDMPLDTHEVRTYNSINLVPRLGYRYQPKEGGFFASVAFTPNLNLRLTRLIFSERLWFGFAIGYSF